jgi:hypothetical protein
MTRRAGAAMCRPISSIELSSRNTPMNPCHYIPFETATLDPSHPLYDDLLDLDMLCTEEGIFINVPTQP